MAVEMDVFIFRYTLIYNLTFPDKGFTVSGAKAAMTLMTGINVGPPRTPNRPLDAQALTAMTQELIAADFKIRKQ